LDEAALIKILTEPKNALVRQYQKKLILTNVKLRFKTDDDSLLAVAGQAVPTQVGGAGLYDDSRSCCWKRCTPLPSQKRITGICDHQRKGRSPSRSAGR